LANMLEDLANRQ